MVIKLFNSSKDAENWEQKRFPGLVMAFEMWLHIQLTREFKQSIKSFFILRYNACTSDVQHNLWNNHHKISSHLSPYIVKKYFIVVMILRSLLAAFTYTI